MDITKIPGIMRHHNWTVGARLMDSWFARPTTVKPAYHSPPEFITMDWALQFSAVKNVYDGMFREKIWSNAAARPGIRRILERKGLLRSFQCVPFGDKSLTAPQADADSVNYRRVGNYAYQYYSYQGLNDLTAALGNFALYMVIAGTVEGTENMQRYKVTISEVGAYIKDSYDFEGDQFLGYWDAEDNSVGTLNAFAGDHVDNKSFRDWRAANGRGGDFLVFSDIKWTRLPRADVFEV